MLFAHYIQLADMPNRSIVRWLYCQYQARLHKVDVKFIFC
jgi:hypothetical protein